jgi:hypothetical protein
MTKKPISQVADAAEASFNRKQAVDFARASLSLSGFKITAAHEVRAQRFIDGEISLEELFGSAR